MEMELREEGAVRSACGWGTDHSHKSVHAGKSDRSEFSITAGDGLTKAVAAVTQMGVKTDQGTPGNWRGAFAGYWYRAIGRLGGTVSARSETTFFEILQYGSRKYFVPKSEIHFEGGGCNHRRRSNQGRVMRRHQVGVIFMVDANGERLKRQLRGRNENPEGDVAGDLIQLARLKQTPFLIGLAGRNSMDSARVVARVF